ncbi:hypothetical protein RRG08_026335 [Elysia crispata]|uniref:Nudix hydrolase domain-containing protein n=1 Tax=Elysia crispata TaxID=231223 RepID=A0AAE1DCW4_9GAST|nr:hypothetical protein RRG08_026335 [Elysia crispata]
MKQDIINQQNELQKSTTIIKTRFAIHTFFYQRSTKLQYEFIRQRTIRGSDKKSGMRDEIDESDIDAALREAEEEIGLPRSAVTILGLEFNKEYIKNNMSFSDQMIGKTEY